MNDCIEVSTAFAWLGDTNPGTAPPGWEMPLSEFGTRYTGSYTAMQIFHCTRVSWGSFERPMEFLLESHTEFSEPETCSSETSYLAILNAFWVEDADFASFLESEYQIPVVRGELTPSFDNASTPSQATWTWKVHGGEESTLTVYVAGSSDIDTISHDRYVWDNGAGVSYIDLNGTQQLAADIPNTVSPTQYATGVMRPPMLYASLGENYVGLAQRVLSGDWDGDIKEFSDYRCEQPK